MLRELHITNLAVIEDARVELKEGLNCFTGQTGAGKSLLLGALELLLGLRSGTEMLREGATEGRVTALFELKPGRSPCRPGLELPIDEGDDQLLITRKLSSTGRSSFSINGSPATASMVKALGERLVDVHGQHDHQYLLQPAHQLDVLDRFGECESLRSRFAEIHTELASLRSRRGELAASQTLRRQQLELHEFQAEEIDKAQLAEAGEFDEVAARHKLLSNLRKVQQESAAAYAAIYEAEGSVLERMQAVVGVLRQLSELDEELSPVAESVKAAAAQVQDASFELSRYLNRIDLDPAELADVTDRLNTLNRVIHKYGQGGGLEAVLAHREQIEREMVRLRGESSDVQEIDRKMEPLRKELETLGNQLTAKRQAAARKLAPLIEKELSELGMAQATFGIQFDALTEPSPSGSDRVEMLVQANPGQPARPLRKVASGGELSRIMLAIKSVLAEADQIGVLVFDEIDANIGGRIASTIGQKLRGLARDRQVLCITHLPQIAAYADHHVRITKSIAAGQTRVGVDPLPDRESRINELSEMLTGRHQSDATRQQAEELLSIAGYIKSQKPKRALRLTG